jgi:hypothetical protein
MLLLEENFTMVINSFFMVARSLHLSKYTLDDTFTMTNKKYEIIIRINMAYTIPKSFFIHEN